MKNHTLPNKSILKRTIALLLSAIFVFALSPQAFGVDGPGGSGGSGPETVTITEVDYLQPTYIYSAEDMRLLEEQYGGWFILGADIDMADLAPASDPNAANWTPVYFSGTLDGNGHTIYNLKVDSFGSGIITAADNAGTGTVITVDGNAVKYDTVAAGLFSVLDGATIQDLGIRGADITVSSDRHCFAGALAGYMQNTAVNGVTISDTRVSLTAAIKPEPGSARKSCNAGVGGIAGFGGGTGPASPLYNQVKNCSVDVTLIFDDQCAPSLKVEQFLGGILGAGYADISGCTVNIDGYAAIRGYAHNGGLVGMFYVYDGTDTIGFISGCTVNGAIHFFEDNRDRRAYCDPYVGEKMTWPKFSGLKNDFRNAETINYSAKMNPEKCAEPQISSLVTPGSCSSWGFTTHTCSVCGNSWKDSFTPEIHQPGDWQIVSQPSKGTDGLRVKKCGLCGKTVEQQTLKAVQKLSTEPIALKISYKDSAVITAAPEPSDAWPTELVWTSSDESIATVDNTGRVTAVGRGEALITCSTPDGFAQSSSSVTVNYTFGQWLIKIFLFGWIWY